MKDKSWIIILVMAIALAISIGYSIIISQRNDRIESTVTTTSIIEMTATTVTIKNTLTGTGTIEYLEVEETILDENNETQNNVSTDDEEANSEETNIEETTEESEKEAKNSIYQIVLSIEDKDLEKAEVGQDVEISIKNDEEILNYTGKIININESTNNKSTIDIEIINPDENVKENMVATCTVIIEKAEDVVALPIEAIQKNEQNETYVDVVQDDGTTTSVIIETGISDDYYVEITSGLNVGDRVQIIKSTTTVVNDENVLKTTS